jgi:hypothetical protein
MKELSETAAAWVGAAPQSTATQTVSDQIRALDKAGLPRAEIARRLGKRYQHVRNVLEGDKARDAGKRASSSAFAAPAKLADDLSSNRAQIYRIEVSPNGVMTLPEQVRAALKATECGVLIGRLEGSDFTLTDAWTSGKRVQARFAALNLGSGSMADELIADRRAEAARELDD